MTVVVTGMGVVSVVGHDLHAVDARERLGEHGGTFALVGPGTCSAPHVCDGSGNQDKSKARVERRCPGRDLVARNVDLAVHTLEPADGVGSDVGERLELHGVPRVVTAPGRARPHFPGSTHRVLGSHAENGVPGERDARPPVAVVDVHAAAKQL